MAYIYIDYNYSAPSSHISTVKWEIKRGDENELTNQVNHTLPTICIEQDPIRFFMQVNTGLMWVLIYLSAGMVTAIL